MRHTDCAIFGNWKLSWQNVNTYNNISGSCLKSGKHMWISGRVTEEASVNPEFNPGWEHQIIQQQAEEELIGRGKLKHVLNN